MFAAAVALDHLDAGTDRPPVEPFSAAARVGM
jgi:hypothetical protein